MPATDYGYTGQRSLDEGMGGLMDYRARFYSTYITQFNQPDIIIPDPANPQAWNRYAYGLNNPSRYTDPSGHRPCELVCEGDIIDWNKAKKGSAWYGEWDVKKQKTNQKIAKAILEDGTELVASVLFEPADWAYTANHCFNGECSPWMLAGLLPLIPSSIGKHADDIIDAGKGFDNFRQLKKAIGEAGENMEWHHIVEQSQIMKSGFLPQQIHNVENVLAVDKTVHRQISGFYRSNIAGPGTQRVRDWLAGQSFETQYEFGIQVLKKFSVIP